MMHFKIIYCCIFLLGFCFNQHAQVPNDIHKSFSQSMADKRVEAYLSFFNENINNHYSQNYYWVDSCRQQVSFNELDYSDFSTSVNAFNSIKKSNGGLLPITYDSSDVSNITKDILKSSISQALTYAASTPDNKHIVKEFLLPYRVTDEPLTHWHDQYNERFKMFQDSNNNATVSNIIDNVNSWFICTYGIEERQDPLNHLSALQLLHRKKGSCEDIANLMVFALRSIGIPSSVDVIPLWGTTKGGHVLNSYFDDDCNAIHFDALSYDQPLPFNLEREPAKVFRLTYSENEKSLASNIDVLDIPNIGLLRSKNYIDVTNEYWPTADITFEADKKYENQYLFTSVFNGMQWKPVWYSKVNDNKAIFENMAKGVVYILHSFENNKPAIISNPKAFTGTQIVTFNPKKETHNIRITELPGYLKFRPGKVYTLYYFDKKWIKHSRKIPGDSSRRLIYKNVPKNALLILRPEYSEGKERPFTIQDNGTRLWW